MLDKGGGYIYVYVCMYIADDQKTPLSQEGANEEKRKKNIST